MYNQYDIIELEANKKVIVHYDSEALPLYIEFIIDNTKVKYFPENNQKEKDYLLVYRYGKKELEIERDANSIRILGDATLDEIAELCYF